MEESVLVSESHGAVLCLTLNRPTKLNAFDVALTAALIAALETAERDGAVRAIVVRGAGRAFSAGQDLEEFVRMQASDGQFSIADHLRGGYNAVTQKVRAIEKPVIASLGGITVGFGLSLALACDVRVAADDAQLTLGFSKIGLIPDGGGSLFLPLLAGLGRALELAWTSELIDAREAHRIGLVNRVVPSVELDAEALKFALRLAEMSPVALALTKRAFNRALLPHLTQWLNDEAELQAEAADGPDLREGVRSFLEKRKPAFGRD